MKISAMLQTIPFEKILFLDIETVPAVSNFDLLDERMQHLWTLKSQQIAKKEDDTPASLYSRAGIYAEFGKIVCISVGNHHEGVFKIKSFYGDNEEALLKEFANLLNRKFHTKNHLLCAHNGKEFDFPYIARRMLIHKIKIPDILNLAGRKPWEVNLLDTMELWKFGDYKHYTSLDLLAAVFNIPTPKDDIDGSRVAQVYYEEKNLERIATYCGKDVLTIAQLFRCYRGEELYDLLQVEYI